MAEVRGKAFIPNSKELGKNNPIIQKEGASVPLGELNHSKEKEERDRD